MLSMLAGVYLFLFPRGAINAVTEQSDHHHHPQLQCSLVNCLCWSAVKMLFFFGITLLKSLLFLKNSIRRVISCCFCSICTEIEKTLSKSKKLKVFAKITQGSDKNSTLWRPRASISLHKIAQ